MHYCEKCSNTGSTDGGISLDCAAPGCNMATTFVELDAWIRGQGFGLSTVKDRAVFLYAQRQQADQPNNERLVVTESALSTTRKLLAAWERGEVPPKDATGTHYDQAWLDSAPEFNAPGLRVQRAGALTDEQIAEVWDSMPGQPGGFVKEFGYLQFAWALLAAAKGGV